MLTTNHDNLPSGFRVARVNGELRRLELGMISSKILPASAVYFGESNWENWALGSEESIP